MKDFTPKGYLAFVLHAHLPFVRHPEYEDFLEEDWLYEAITETYIPLLTHYEELIEDGIDFRITMTITPPLISMLTDELLQSRYIRHIERLIELARKEVERTRWMKDFNKIAKMYLRKFEHCRYMFVEKHNRNLISGFKAIQDAGKLEIITCGATHGFFPLMLPTNLQAVRAQVKVAMQIHTKHFGKPPSGIWLPECGFVDGVDKILRENGIRYFFVDAHGILLAHPRPRYGVFAPIFAPQTGVAAFGRDLESSKSVWSSDEGYPGDYNYREFYRDVGFDLEFEYIQKYIHESGLRKNTGIKYYKITGSGSLDDKESYNPQIALEKASEHAGNFVFNRERQIEHLASLMQRQPPIIISPYDAELFGHWWYEGPDWLNYVLRKISCDSKTIKLITPKEFLDMYPTQQVATPTFSSWGHKGYAEVWLEKSNDWIYRHLHKAADRMVELANTYGDAYGDLERALNQAARELLLAQSSDWAFIIKTGTMVEYAIKRTKDYVSRFTKIYHQIRGNRLDMNWLSEIEYKDNIFPDIDFRVYRTLP